MCTTRAKVVVSGGEPMGIRNQEYYFTGEPNEAFLKATSFAQGFAFACTENNPTLHLKTPHEPRKDGFMWWQQGGEMKIETLTTDNKPIKTAEDITNP